MARSRQVPVTPSVIEWALEQAGKTREDLAAATKTDRGVVDDWLRGASQPSLTQARNIARVVRRPLAFLLWSEPPARSAPALAFRSAGKEARDLNPDERRLVRQARRVQEAVSWLRSEFGEEPVRVPRAAVGSSASEAAETLRKTLGVGVDEQCAWASQAKALANWRNRIEALGILVFQMALGSKSCKGVTLLDDYAPAIIINTAYNHGARIFTLFHELAHLMSRTASACDHSLAAPNSKADPVERWCEHVASETLLPWPSVKGFLAEKGHHGPIDQLAVAASVARKFNVSLSAAVVRLITKRFATWSLWEQISKTTDDKKRGGQPPDEPRTTPVVRIAEFGRPAAEAIVRGVESDLLDRSQATSYLRVDHNTYADLRDRLVSDT